MRNKLLVLNHTKYNYLYIMGQKESPMWYFRTIEKMVKDTNAKVIFDVNRATDNINERFFVCEIKNKVFDLTSFTKLPNISDDLLQAIAETSENKAQKK